MQTRLPVTWGPRPYPQNAASSRVVQPANRVRGDADIEWELPDAPVGTGLPSSAGQHIDELWLIQNKSNPEESFGELGFGTGKLTWASKEWTHENMQYGGTETAEIIYKILSGFEASGVTNCAVKTFSSPPRSGPGGIELRETRINCGVRHLEINLIWQSGPANIEINEVLGGE